MSSALDKWRDDERALDVERRLMNEALTRLSKTETKPAVGHATGRLIFGLDLTGSRDAGLRGAQVATASMFSNIKAIGRVALKLIYYRGIDECRESRWYDDPDILTKSMMSLSCEVGATQIVRLLSLVDAAEDENISGMVFIGDHCEEDHDELVDLARRLGRKSIPLFIFHECADDDRRSLKAKPIFKRIADVSKGQYVEFKPDSGAVLREILLAVAAFSAAGIEGVQKVALPTTSEARDLRGRLMLGTGNDAKRLK
jgi:hypothetical protein